MTDIVDIGDAPNDGTGDPLRVAFDKINQNFANLALLAPQGPNGAFQFKSTTGYPNGTANLVYDVDNNIINIGGNLVPVSETSISIGSPTDKIAKLYLDQESLVVGNISVTEDANILSFPITVLPGTMAGIHVNDITADGNVTITGSLILENIKIDTFDIVTSNNAANQIIFETPAIGFNSGTFKITSREASSNNTQTVTLVATKNNGNTVARFNAYGTVFIGSPVTRYNADVGFGNVRIMVSPIPNITVTHTVSYQIETQ